MDNYTKTQSKSKTFQKGEDCIVEILDFVTSNLETDDYQPEGIASYNDGLSPYDPRSDLKHKYIITVTKVIGEISLTPQSKETP